MKSLEQELAESKAKLENLSNTKLAIDNRSAFVFVDLVNACETLCRELTKSMKIAKKFKEELKLANLEKEELICEIR